MIVSSRSVARAAAIAVSILTAIGCGSREEQQTAKQAPAPQTQSAAPDNPDKQAKRPKEAKGPRGKEQEERIAARTERKKLRREEKQRKIADAESDRANVTIPNVPPPMGDKQPNVLLVTIDTLRADHLACYGYNRQTSKCMDALASEGIVFENAYVQRNSTWPSLATVMTSLHPVVHGVRHNGLQLSNAPITLAEVLQANGYMTAAVYTNSKGQNWEGFQVRHPITTEPVDERATHEAISWLADARRPFFLWIHYLAPHADYTPPAEFQTFVDPNYKGPIDGKKESIAKATLRQFPVTPEDLQHVYNLYDGEIAYVDNELNKVIDTLKARDLYDNTLIVLSADHGEELYDHHGYFGHGASVYEGVMRVPLIMRMPGTVPAGKRDASVVGTIDVAPTILQTVGIAVPESYQGRSLAPAFKGEQLTPTPAFAEFRDKILLVRTNDYTYVYNPTNYHPRKIADNRQVKVGAGEDKLVKQEEFDGTADLKEGTYRDEDVFTQIKAVELYDAINDRYQKQEISAQRPEAVAAMQKEIDAFSKRYNWSLDDGVAKRIESEVDPEVRAQLEAMGYIMNEGESEEKPKQ